MAYASYGWQDRSIIQVVDVKVLTAILPDPSSDPCKFFNKAISSIDEEGMQNKVRRILKHAVITNRVELFDWDTWRGASVFDYTNEQDQ